MFYSNIDFISYDETHVRVLALCFAAAMADAGDLP
jgi:hypothetical protein